MNTPKVICTTAIMTDIFIFKELTKLRLFSATDQTGSNPNGYTQSPFLGIGDFYCTPATSKQEPNMFKLIER
jgi:hypothetical protein